MLGLGPLSVAVRALACAVAAWPAGTSSAAAAGGGEGGQADLSVPRGWREFHLFLLRWCPVSRR